MAYGLRAAAGVFFLGVMADIEPIQLPAIRVPAGNRPPASPFQFFLLGNEGIQIRSWNTLAGVNVRFVCRFINARGQMSWVNFDHTPNTDASIATTFYPLGEGFIVNCAVFATGAAPRVGQTFVQVQIVVGSEQTAARMGTLLQGYVTQNQELAYPGSPIMNSLDGGGYVRFATASAPGAGLPLIVTVPTGVRWELVSVIGAFFTDATVINRRTRLLIDDGVTVSFVSWTPQDQPAGQSFTMSWAQGMPLATNLLGGNSVMGLGYSAPLLAGHRFALAALSMQAGDFFTDTTYTVREWIEAT